MSNHEDRMLRLTQKLKNIEISDRGGRMHRLLTIEGKISQLENKFDQLKGENESDMKILRQQATKLIKEAEDSNELFSSQYNVERIIDAVATISHRVDTIVENNRQSDARVVRTVDERSRALKAEIAKERRVRIETVEDLCVAIKESFPKLEHAVKEESNKRTEADELILKKINQEVAEIDIELGKEKGVKEENEKAIFDIIKDTVEKVKRELENEKKDREQSEQGLMRLLEESMQKLNSMTQP